MSAIGLGSGAGDTNLYRPAANTLCAVAPFDWRNLTIKGGVPLRARLVMGVFAGTCPLFGETICVPPPGMPVGTWRGYAVSV